MYFLSTQLESVKGIGSALAEKFAAKNIFTVKDLLLFLPLRYEDRSQTFTIKQLQENNSPEKAKNFKTIKAKVISTSNFYRGRRSMQNASVQDETGKLKLTWFNNPWIIKKLEKDKEYIFSGKINDKGVMTQAVAEEVKEDNIHTGRLVPIYSILSDIKQGTLRKILKEIVDNLDKDCHKSPLIKEEKSGASQIKVFSDANKNTPNSADAESAPLSKRGVLDIYSTLTQLHFPDTSELVIKARERLALEELLSLIKHSNQIKKNWQQQDNAIAVETQDLVSLQVPDSIPFTLTKSQNKSTQEILADISKTTPMNRLLIGDVGSGKTVVAGVAIYQVIKNGHNACLIAPTQILAEQHVKTFKKLFPNLKIKLVTGKTKWQNPSPLDGEGLESESTRQQSEDARGEVYIGTHALINKLEQIKPALIIYDEQHRFGVSQRAGFVKNETRYSVSLQKQIQPHVLTMSATPIPRSLMLTIFSHLNLSVIDEMPPGRKSIKTWALPQKKREGAYNWIFNQLNAKPSPLGEELESEPRQSEDARGEVRKLAIIVCPFINPSQIPGFENIASATQIYQELKTQFIASQEHEIALLHGKLTQTEKDQVSQALFAQKIDILVTTPVIEVGLDLPNADVVLIESAERFGLASLHQLRGRVGRAGQDSFCMVIPSASVISTRLKEFAAENNGMKLAEKDLQRRGAGNLFGTEQHGFDQLKFASWTNLELLAKARQIFEKIERKELEWEYFFKISHPNKDESLAAN